MTVSEAPLSFLDPRVGGTVEQAATATVDNAAAFTAAWALMPFGGELLIPAGVVGVATQVTVPGGVKVRGHGMDYSVVTAGPGRGTAIQAIATIAAGAVVRLGDDQTSTASGKTAAKLESLMVDGAGLADYALRTFGRRTRVRDCQIWRGALVAAQLDGQNTNLLDCIVGQNATGDCVVTNNNDIKIAGGEIRQPGTSGAALRFLQTNAYVERVHMYTGALGSPTTGVLVLIDATNGTVQGIQINNCTFDICLGPQVKLLSGANTINNVTITGNSFYNNNGLTDNVYYAIEANGAGNISNIAVGDNVVYGQGPTNRYKAFIGSLNGGTRNRWTVSNNNGLYVAKIFDVVIPTQHFANTMYNGTSTVHDRNEGKSTQSGTGSQTAFTIAHGLDGTPARVNVTPGSVAASSQFSVTADATNITVTFAAAPASGSSNVVMYWSAGL